MNEKLIRVDCDYSLQNSQLESVSYTSGTLGLTLSSVRVGEIKIVFDWIHSFRLIDEGDLLKMQDEQNGEMQAGIYIVDNSTYLKWFSEQCIDIHDDESIIHYLVVTSDEVVDVLSSVSPFLTNC